MGDKRKPSPHQRQVRFLSILFGILLVLIAVGIILLLNAPIGGYWHH